MPSPKSGGKEAALRAARERATSTLEPPRGRTDVNVLGDPVAPAWRDKLPKAGIFYMTLSGNAHKAGQDFSWSSNDRPLAYYVHPACAPTTRTLVRLRKDEFGFPEPFSGDPSLQCQYCLKGETMPDQQTSSTKRKKASSPTVTAPTTEASVPAKHGWETVAQDDPMYPIARFFGSLASSLADGVDAKRAQELVLDEVRAASLYAFYELAERRGFGPPEDWRTLFTTESPKKAKSATKSRAKAKVEPVAEAATDTETKTDEAEVTAPTETEVTAPTEQAEGEAQSEPQEESAPAAETDSSASA